MTAPLPVLARLEQAHAAATRVGVYDDRRAHDREQARREVLRAVPALLSAIREFAELDENYPLGTDVPVYRLGRVLDRLAAALEGDTE